MPKKKKNKSIIIIAIIILLILFIFIFLFYFRGHIPTGECESDIDCPVGQICTINNNCISIQTNLETDNICSDNSYGYGEYDPDCPAYCPPSLSGQARFCCYVEHGEISVDCLTGSPLNINSNIAFLKPEQKPDQKWYNRLQSVISFTPEDKPKEYIYISDKVKNLINIPVGAAPGAALGYKVWLSSVTISPSLPYLEGKWKECKIGQIPCISKDGEREIKSNKIQHSAWVTPELDLNYIEDGIYTITYKYCAQPYPISTIEERCYESIYILEKGKETFDLSIQVSQG